MYPFNHRIMHFKFPTQCLACLKNIKNCLPQRTSWVTMSLVIALISCTRIDQGEVDPNGLFADVKTITTRFVSHQSDTQQKDDKVVAVARFLPDGSLDRVDQHMTYPYDYKQSFEREFWGQPIKMNLSHVMDGLDLGEAEKNLMYGNDWPVTYEQYVSKNGHPRLTRREGSKPSSKAAFLGNGLPARIQSRPDPNQPWIFDEEIFEEFEYTGRNIAKYINYLEVPDRISLTSKRPSGTKTVKANWKEVEYEYDGDRLVAVSDGKVVFRFQYEGDQLASSEYYLNDKLYNTRRYAYNDNGLKTKTEVFNVFGEPEYTILYEYTFYEE